MKSPSSRRIPRTALMRAVRVESHPERRRWSAAREVGKQRVARLMREMGLQGIVKLTLSERTYCVELISFALIGRHRLPPARR